MLINNKEIVENTIKFNYFALAKKLIDIGYAYSPGIIVRNLYNKKYTIIEDLID